MWISTVNVIEAQQIVLKAAPVAYIIKILRLKKDI